LRHPETTEAESIRLLGLDSSSTHVPKTKHLTQFFKETKQKAIRKEKTNSVNKKNNKNRVFWLLIEKPKMHNNEKKER
jgi:hypothetical protein